MDKRFQKSHKRGKSQEKKDKGTDDEESKESFGYKISNKLNKVNIMSMSAGNGRAARNRAYSS